MIFVRDKGRMCNNILQYGHVYAWGREHGRRTMSMRFAYKYQYFNICRTPWHNFMVYFIVKKLVKWKLIPSVDFDELSEPFEDKVEKIVSKKNILAEGWSVRFYDLFIKYKSEIIDMFSFNDKINAVATRLIENKAHHCDIKLGVHIRRGDYKTWNGGKYYFSDEEYIAYIKQFSYLFQNKRVVVFVCGNDPKLNKQFYINELQKECVCFPKGNPGEDLCVLSKCDYIIGAPSTFSLVASMYNDTPLYWIENKEAKLDTNCFGKFDDLFRKIR